MDQMLIGYEQEGTITWFPVIEPVFKVQKDPSALFLKRYENATPDHVPLHDCRRCGSIEPFTHSGICYQCIYLEDSNKMAVFKPRAFK